MEIRDEATTQSQPNVQTTEKVFRFISDPKHKENLSGRVRAACLNCRRKKIKCSGEKNCRICRDRGVVCEGFPERKRPKQSTSPKEVATNDADGTRSTLSRVDRPRQPASRRASMTSNTSQASIKADRQNLRMEQLPLATMTPHQPSLSSTSLLESTKEPATSAFDSRRCQKLRKAWPLAVNPIISNWGLLGELDAQGQFGIFDSTPIQVSPAPTGSTDTSDESSDWNFEELDLAHPERDHRPLPMQFHEPGLDFGLVEGRSSEEPDAESPNFMKFGTALTPEDNSNLDTQGLPSFDDTVIQDLDRSLGGDVMTALDNANAALIMKWNEQMPNDGCNLPPAHIWRQLQLMVRTKSLGGYDGPLFEWPAR